MKISRKPACRLSGKDRKENRKSNKELIINSLRALRKKTLRSLREPRRAQLS